MKRRNFIKNTAASGIAMAGFTGTMGAVASDSVKSAAKKFNLNYAPHFGMFRHSAGDDLIDQLKFMADQGFTAFEDNGLLRRDTATQNKIGETIEKLGMTMGVFVVPKGGNMANTLAAGKKEHLDIFLDGCRKSVEAAKRVKPNG